MGAAARLAPERMSIRIAMRQQVMIEMDDMRHAIIARDGTISIIPKEKK